MLQVFDNLFTKDLLLDLNVYFRTDLSWSINNVANRHQYPISSSLCEGSHLLFGKRIYHRHSRYKVHNEATNQVIDVLEHFVHNILKHNGLELFYIDCNLQMCGQDGTSHIDDFLGRGRDRTIMFYPHFEWQESWGGQLQILDDNHNVIEEHYPKPGRIIYFDSSVSHRALGPRVPNVPRFSVAYRMGANSDD